jgi:hypothetical protein
MRDDLNIDLVFPIRDDVSAGLMCVKAELLYDAGIINASELNGVIGRASAIIDEAEGAESRHAVSFPTCRGVLLLRALPTAPSANQGR